ncbi:MAG: hypothetical protein IPM23_21965 [Candidatus Melainabacteria bacterium]|nr:hypothetical protein [Candidatus Melainabacteria bacterium]
MSSEPRNNFDWIAIGKIKTPRDLVFIGDIEAPTLPDSGRSPNSRDRRYWKKAFTSPARVSLLLNDKYLPLDEEPRLQEIYTSYKRRCFAQESATKTTRSCESSRIDAIVEREEKKVEPIKSVMMVLNALSALSQSKRGIPLKEFQDIIGKTLKTSDFHAREHLIRGWSESGVIDLLRRQDRSQTIVVPRKPRFILVRKGPTVDATLVGLATTNVVSAIESVSNRISFSKISAPSEYQPYLLRIENTRPDEVQSLSERIGLPPPEWLYYQSEKKRPSTCLLNHHRLRWNIELQILPMNLLVVGAGKRQASTTRNHHIRMKSLR